MAKTKNKYDCPVDLNEITGIFRNKSPAHSLNYKNGIYKNAIDFICPVGTHIKAAADGIVVEVACDSDAGGNNETFDKSANFIEIRHSNREYSEYEHLKKDSALVKVGDVVKQGQIIAKSGATGWLAELGPHLHFMVGTYQIQTLKIVWKKDFL